MPKWKAHFHKGPEAQTSLAGAREQLAVLGIREEELRRFKGATGAELLAFGTCDRAFTLQIVLPSILKSLFLY